MFTARSISLTDIRTANMLYYYLASLSNGHWALYSSLESRPSVHADKLTAMLEAKNRCRQYWGRTGNPCGVRIQARHGRWDEHYLVGDMAEAAPEDHETDRTTAGRLAPSSNLRH
jgi:hypothetical protein